jgi:hypothetical protein
MSRNPRKLGGGLNVSPLVESIAYLVSNPLPFSKLAWLEQQRRRVGEEFERFTLSQRVTFGTAAPTLLQF